METVFNSILAAFDALAQHEIIVWTVAAGMIAAYFIFNLIVSPYPGYKNLLKKNVKYLKQCAVTKTAANAGKLRIPRALCDGYDNYVQSRGRFPSETMKFAPEPARYYGLSLVVAALALCFAMSSVKVTFAFAPFVLAAALALVQTALCFAKSQNEKSAQKATLAFTRWMDKCFGQSKGAKQLSAGDVCLDNDVDEVVAKIDFLKANGISSDTAKEVAELLADDKLNKPRTFEQQKRLNLALNGLLQVMTKKQEQHQS